MALQLLRLLIFLCICSSVFPEAPIRCHPAEKELLLKIRSSCFLPDEAPDCCNWDGVRCDDATNNVISLSLSYCDENSYLLPDSPVYEFRHLRELSFSCSVANCTIRNEIGKLTQLESFSCHGFRGAIPFSIGNLRNLTSLTLSYNEFSETIPASVGYLSSLTTLVITQNNLSGSIPTSIENLSSLTTLVITQNYLSGSIPTSIGNLPNLISLDLQYNNLTGSIPDSIGNLPNLISLDLQYNNLTGSIPDSIGKLSNLNSLDLKHNSLSGSIPQSIGNLTGLSSLLLSNNNLSGMLPFSIFQLPNLELLYVHNNRLQGPLPKTVPLDLKLYIIDLRNNLLTGDVPGWLFTRSLDDISASGNRFSGVEDFHVPTRGITNVFLNNNLIEGIPKSLFSVNIKFLALDQNRLSGAWDISTLQDHFTTFYFSWNLSSNEGLSLVNTKGNISCSVFWLYMDNCNLTEFPNFLGSLSGLQILSVSRNKMRGIMDLSKGWDLLSTLDASFNFLEGSSKVLPASLRTLNLSHNNFVGDVPASFCMLNNLDLSFNRLNGVVQWTSDNCFDSEIEFANLNNNNLHGSIPDVFFNLRVLLLNGNNFGGTLPRSLAKCEDLMYLDVGNNNITDTFPGFLGSLQFLYVLVISSNNFMGNVTAIKPPNGFPFPNLLVLDASNNKFSGLLPMKYIQNFNYLTDWESVYIPKYGDQIFITFKGFKDSINNILSSEKVNFSSIDLSKNQFSGPIPSAFGYMKKLNGLNLNENKLTGEIPKPMGMLMNLRSLDLSGNMLSGSISSELVNLRSIGYLNFSNNHLEGQIPKGLPFSNSSYFGNVGLCGFPLSKHC